MTTKIDADGGGGLGRGRVAGGALRRLAPMMLLLLSLLLLAPGGRAAAQPLVFYGDRALAPYEYAGPGGEPAGASVDLARAVGRALGRPVEIRLTDLADAQAKVLAGEGDALLTQSPTRGRQPLFDFSNPTLPAPFGLFVRAETRDGLAARELGQLVVGVAANGYAQAFFAEHHADLSPVVVRDTAAGVERLLRGDIDVFAGPTWAVTHYLERRGSGDVVRFSTFSQRFTAFAVRDGGGALLADLNRGLEMVRASGEYDLIVGRWAPAVPHQLSSRQYGALWAGLILALVAGVSFGVAAAVSRRERRRLAAEVARRVQVEAELVAASARAIQTAELLAFSLRGASAAAYEVDLRTERVIWSDGYHSLFGLPPDTPPSREGWEKAVHPGDARLWWEALERAAAARQEEFSHIYRIVHPDRGIRWMDCRSRIWYGPDGRPERTGGINFDITELLQATEDLKLRMRESAELRADLMAIMDAAPAAIWIARDPEGRVIDGNRASNEMLRVPPGVNLSKSAAETGHLRFSVLDTEGRELSPDQLPVQRAARGEFVHGCELMLRFEDGDIVHEYGNAVPLFAPDGTVKGAVAAFIDISRLKRVEAALRLAKIEAEKANRAKSRFLAAASHDLRQPLQALGFYLGTLEERLGGAEKALMTPIRACMGSLRALLDDLLDLGRLDAGVLAPKPAPVSVADLLSRVRAAHGPAAVAKGLRLRMAGASPVVEADPVLLERMVGNLVSNAIRYTETGGVLVGCRRRGGLWRIEVWDTGIGIPAGRTAEIFEEFVQLDNSQRDREKGAGLGLAIVRRLAGLTGCEVGVRSRVGRGSVFHLALPGPSMLVGVPPAAPPETGAGPRALRVALIEDDVTVRDALACAIGGWGHEVRAAASPAQVLAELAGRAPDLVISDYRLPGGETGLGAVATLRAAFGDGLAAVILTGETAPDVVREISGQGIEIRHKPLDFDELRACLEAHASPPAAGGRRAAY